jgi:hypothetical protein
MKTGRQEGRKAGRQEGRQARREKDTLVCFNNRIVALASSFI